MASLDIRQFICRSDNYGVLIHDRASGATAAIDTPDEAAVRGELARAGYRLTHIFTTHHHFDHVAGHQGLKRDTGCFVYGPEKEKDKIPALDETVKEGDRIAFGAFELHVIETPGHTLGHVSYFIEDAVGPANGVVFAGDTMFSVGCGRVLEGSYLQMWASLEKLKALPSQTLLYCGHEYTRSNVAFALTVEPDSAALGARQLEVETALADGKPTLPVTLARELETNPFLRTESPAIRHTIGVTPDASGAEIFEILRRRKDTF